MFKNITKFPDALKQILAWEQLAWVEVVNFIAQKKSSERRKEERGECLKLTKRLVLTTFRNLEEVHSIAKVVLKWTLHVDFSYFF